jgi:hypothetical protein
MSGPFADRLFRIAFALAGFYNLAFGLWASLRPLAFFDLFELAPPRYPGIWACLGMVVGVYGLLYWFAAWRLESAWPIIAVGFLGKVLGPIGMVMSFDDDWPRRLGMICIYNDLIWWLPFGLFLVRGTELGRRLVQWAPWLCIAIHVAALVVTLVFLRRGTFAESNEWFRAAFIAENTATWSVGWGLWMLSAASFVGFCAWWGGRLAARNVAVWGVLIAAFGTIFDLSGEGLLILSLVERAASVFAFEGELFHPWNAAAFMSVERSFTLLSAGAANGLYTVGGILLTLVTPNLPTWVRTSMWGTWLAGIAMTIAGIMNHVGGLMASSVVLFPLLIIWIAWMAVRWRRQ